jgi:beta-glucoside operon transcriptional antiterminator
VDVLKVFNNNVLLARDEQGGEVVLTGRGLGFQVKPGDRVDASKVTRTFVPDAAHSASELTTYLTDIPPETLALAGEIVDGARERLGFGPSQGIVIPMADHINFAIRRARQGMVLEYPLRSEVAHLYPNELAVAREAVTLISARTGVPLNQDEAVPIALHFVNALFATGDLSRTFAMTEVFTQIFQVLTSAFDRDIDESGINAARFVTHLRYFFVRVDAGKQLRENQGPFASVIREAYPAAYACALKVRALLELRLNARITEDEVTYLTLHVARLSADLDVPVTESS